MFVSIQIGNTDNKLTQQEWHEFCSILLELCEKYGMVHFNGGPATFAPWQNYCVCLNTNHDTILKNEIKILRAKFKQDSVAWLQGEIEFI